MNKLYEELVSGNSIFDAYIVIKNELSHDPGNVEIFEEFMASALRIAGLDMDYNSRKKYLGEADMALTIFAESVVIKDLSTLDMIKEYTDKVADMAESIQNAEEKELESIGRKRRANNQKEFKKLTSIYEKMEKVETQEEFDSLLKEISEIEENLEKNAFDDIQRKSYETMTQSFSKLISEKMDDLNYQRLLEKNKEAIKNFKHVFDRYNEKKNFYNKNEADLKALVTKNLFSYDSRELLNESLIYFNHVYTTIFNGVGDDLKYKLTEWSITSEKTKRD